VTKNAITYDLSAEDLEADDLGSGFFDGWATPLSPSEHLQLLRHATHVVLATEDTMVVGFVNALSDGVLSAYIPLLEVIPSHRGRGIGSELVRRLLLQIGPIYMVDVMCDDDVVPFYERLGFTRAGGVVRRNYAWREAVS
jgi:ribosomal protein S18 acetylase RimI-like enzyme